MTLYYNILKICQGLDPRFREDDKGGDDNKWALSIEMASVCPKMAFTAIIKV